MAASLTGIVCALLVIPPSNLTVGYVAWHVVPYLSLVALALLLSRLGYIWLGAAAFMALVDAWILTDASLGWNSPVLMTMGLAAALRPIILLPIGLCVGGAAQWMAARSKV